MGVADPRMVGVSIGEMTMASCDRKRLSASSDPFERSLGAIDRSRTARRVRSCARRIVSCAARVTASVKASSNPVDLIAVFAEIEI